MWEATSLPLFFKKLINFCFFGLKGGKDSPVSFKLLSKIRFLDGFKDL